MDGQMLKSLLLLCIALSLFMPDMAPASVRSHHSSPQAETDTIFKLKRLKSYTGSAGSGILLNDGTVVFYFEKTRPATDKEKTKRLEEFDRRWEVLKRKARKTIPAVKKELKGAQNGIQPLFPFYAIVPEFFSRLMDMGMDIAYLRGREYVLNQPVVTEAGFVFDSIGKGKKRVLLDLKDTYGQETWQRMPNDAVNIRASADGRFVAVETDKKGVVLYELKDRIITSLKRLEGGHPFGFSPDGKHMFVSIKKGVFRIYTLPPLRPEGLYHVLPPFRAIRLVRLSIPKGIPVTDAALVDRYLVMLTWKELSVYDFMKERLVRRYELGGRSLLIGGEGLFVARMDGTLAHVDFSNMRVNGFKMNRFDLLKTHRVYFHRLVSITPDGRYIAALYDPGLIPPEGVKNYSASTTGESRLFIWDIKHGRVVWQGGESLESITGGFGYTPPVWMSKDWHYLLLNIKDDGIELWQGG